MRFTRRLSKTEWQFVGGLAVLIGCACAPPARPTPLDFSGSWSGTTSQGRPITFTVSSDLRITQMGLDYAFATCSGTVTALPNAALSNTSGTAAALVTVAPNGQSGSSRTTVNFLFPSPISANGTAQFADFPGCGNANVTWTAAKR